MQEKNGLQDRQRIRRPAPSGTVSLGTLRYTPEQVHEIKDSLKSQDNYLVLNGQTGSGKSITLA